jgi:hypothetical protein
MVRPMSATHLMPYSSGRPAKYNETILGYDIMRGACIKTDGMQGDIKTHAPTDSGLDVTDQTWSSVRGCGSLHEYTNLKKGWKDGVQRNDDFWVHCRDSGILTGSPPLCHFNPAFIIGSGVGSGLPSEGYKRWPKLHEEGSRTRRTQER